MTREYDEIVENTFIKGAEWADSCPVKPESKQTMTIEAWVARDFDGVLSLYKEEPHREPYDFVGGFIMLFREDNFPSVTWENSPKKVKVTIELCD